MIQDYLYDNKNQTVLQVLDEYIKELQNSKKFENLMHANKLISYRGMIYDKSLQKDLRKFFNETYDLLDQKHPNLSFSIAGRRKSLLSAEKKIVQYSALNQSLDLIRDFYAFRIILFGDNKQLDLVEHCYKVMSEIIEYAATKGFTPCERLPLLGVSNLEEHKNNFFSAFKYKQYIKDYICFQKENGYQSLHLVLVDTKGRYLEIQVRTFEMHTQIECSDANHTLYKKNKYYIDVPIEREKISLYGYSYVNGKVFDYAGIEYPIIIFQRQKNF